MSRDGFTLVEVLVALTLATLGVAIAAGMIASSTDALDVMLAESRRVEAEAEGLLWLGDALLGAAPLTRAGEEFRGTSDNLRFRSTLPVSDGWTEPTSVEVVFERGRLMMRTSSLTLEFADSLRSSAFDYLERVGSTSPWLSRWESATAAPIAVRWRREAAGGTADTTLFFIGRGQ
jgi:prepilin-type N-terminal cleavage/methylation domain-containing protein